MREVVVVLLVDPGGSVHGTGLQPALPTPPVLLPVPGIPCQALFWECQGSIAQPSPKAASSKAKNNHSNSQHPKMRYPAATAITYRCRNLFSGKKELYFALKQYLHLLPPLLSHSFWTEKARGPEVGLPGNNKMQPQPKWSNQQEGFCSHCCDVARECLTPGVTSLKFGRITFLESKRVCDKSVM